MRFRGKVIPPPEPVSVKFYRGNDVFEFKIQAVLSYEDFERMIPYPKPPIVTKIKENRSYSDFNDKKFLNAVERYTEKRTEYIIIKGLQATEGLEWETVKLDEPDTWCNYRKELETTFTDQEISELITAIREANNPTERRQKEAFNSFTPSQGQDQANHFSQKDEQVDMPSGEPANVSV